MKSIFTLEKELAERQAEVAKIQAQIDAKKNYSSTEQLADFLHANLCKYNHTDGCGWYYEMKNGIDNWSGPDHQKYLAKANRITDICQKHMIPNTKIVIDIINAL